MFDPRIFDPYRKAMRDLQGNRILVTGSNGFLGTMFCAMAQQCDVEVVGADISGAHSFSENVRKSLGGQSIPVVETASDFDIADWETLLRDTRPRFVFHLAGATDRGTSENAWNRCVETNTVLTARILGGVLALPRGHRPVFVMPGSQMEYGFAEMPWTEDRAGEPANPYGGSKLAATALVQSAMQSGLITGGVLRFALLFGPGQPPSMVIPEIIVKAMRGISIPMTEGKQRRRFVYAPDAVVALCRYGLRLSRGEKLPPLMNAPAIDPMTIADLALLLRDVLSIPVDLQLGALPSRKTERMEAWPDTSLVDTLSLTSLTGLREALTQTVAWYQSNSWCVKEFGESLKTAPDTGQSQNSGPRGTQGINQ